MANGYGDICVSGAGTSAMNGTYVYSEMYGGKPRYNKAGTNYTILWYNNQWGVGTYSSYGWGGPWGFYGPTYYSNNNVATPDLCTTWSAAQGSAPTVTLCEQPPAQGRFRRIRGSGGMQELGGLS